MNRLKTKAAPSSIPTPAIVSFFDAVQTLLDSPDLDLHGEITAETASKRDHASGLIAAARAQHGAMLEGFAEIGRGAIAAFDEDSNDAESSALKAALDACRPCAPSLPPDNENWAV
jgi:hypothetical protein